MNKTELVNVHDTNIECPFVKGQQWVSVKSICKALDIDVDVQIDAIKSNPILKTVFSPDILMSPGAGTPKEKTFCIPLKYFFGWVFSIDSNLIPVPRRKGWHNYMFECYNAMYVHFYERTALYEDKEKKMIQLHGQIVRILEDKADLSDKLKKLRGEYDILSKTPVGQLQLQLSEN